MPRKLAHFNCYIIAGPNGAGKTTFATEFLPHYANCPNFITSDEPRLIFRDVGGSTEVLDLILYEKLFEQSTG